MAVFFSDHFRQAISDDPGIMTGASVKVVLFRNLPLLSENSTMYTGYSTADELAELTGWAEVEAAGYPLSNTLAVGTLKVGVNNYVMFNEYPFSGMGVAEVRGAAVLYDGVLDGVTDPIILVTTDPFQEVTTLYPGGGLTAVPDENIVGVNKRWLFSWADPPSGSTEIQALVEGPLILYLGAPAFEPSHTQHVWLYPQRANMIANPSFEAPGVDYWSSNGTITRISTPNAPVGAGFFAGQVETEEEVLIAESNLFPMTEERWTIQLLAKGEGNLKVGLVYWNDAFNETSVDWGNEETWELHPDTFVHVTTCRVTPQAVQGMVRIEVEGGAGELIIDQVLCEKGFLKDWPYFDGDTTYGARDDFSWYGGETRRGASYSLWYNNKRALYGGMFSRNISDDTLVTDEVTREQGLVYQWIPAGTFVVPHIDVLYAGDIQSPVLVKTPTEFLPYRVDDDDALGLISPWE